MSYSENNTYELILQRALSNDILSDVDKREGSIIYDALAPICLELAEAYVMMDVLEEQTYLLTATGSNLDKKSYDYGITRESATYSKVVGEFKKYKTDENGSYVYDEHDERILEDMNISEGLRFAIPNTELVYTYIGDENGHHVLQCETKGTIGNQSNRKLISLTSIPELAEAKITDIYISGEDEETDSELRERTRSFLTNTSFGGNIADYIEKVGQIDGVGNLKVFPAWNLNGSVLLSVVDASYNPISSEFQKVLKNKIDPEDYSGEGIGIAPIGHDVTITTPQEYIVNVDVIVDTDANTEINSVKEDIENVINNYFITVRKSFKQDETLAIYQSRIISEIISKVEGVVNVESVLLNGVSSDIKLNDEATIGGQYLPKLGEVSIV